MEVQPDFRELLALLNKHLVECIIVAGYTLAFHGAPRFTGDIANKRAAGRKKDLADIETRGEEQQLIAEQDDAVGRSSAAPLIATPFA